METAQATGSDIEIKVNGITMCYDDLGQGEIPVIFIHAFPFDKSIWKLQTTSLKTSHRVIAYDLRGFGKSPPGNEKPSIMLFADDLVQFMDALEINKSIICGLSLGGYIALNAIHRFANRFKAMILCDTQCIADSNEVKRKRRQTIHQIEEGKINDFAENFIKSAFSTEILTSKSDVIKNTKDIILSTSSKTITTTLKALAQRWETCSSLPEISQPTLIICGKKDTLTPIDQSEYMFNNLRNSTFLSIDQAGHLSNLEQPDQFNRHLHNFISSL